MVRDLYEDLRLHREQDGEWAEEFYRPFDDPIDDFPEPFDDPFTYPDPDEYDDLDDTWWWYDHETYNYQSFGV